MKSIRQRLIGGLTLGLITLSVLGGVALYSSVKRTLVFEFDYALEAKARALTSFAEPGRSGISLRFAEAALPEFEPGPLADYYQVTLSDNSILAKSRSLGSEKLEPEGKFSNARLANGRNVRAISLDFADAKVVLARDRGRLDAELRRLLMGMVVGALSLSVLGFLVVNHAVNFGLLPLRNLAAQVENASIDSRFEEVDVPEELRAITRQLNGLLGRLVGVFQRERRFTSNVAHELATPISELRALTDVALRFANEPAATLNVARDANAIALQMERIVRVLLALGRSQSGRAQIRWEEFDASEVVMESLRFHDSCIRTKELVVVSSINQTRVRSDSTMLRAILFNVIGNAVEYTPKGGKIYCAVGEKAIIVKNQQDSLRQEDLEHLFEPFWRKDPARTDPGHAGLGLPIVKAYSDALGIEVDTCLVGEIFQIKFAFVSST